MLKSNALNEGILQATKKIFFESAGLFPGTFC
jgi:hypothetical protein